MEQEKAVLLMEKQAAVDQLNKEKASKKEISESTGEESTENNEVCVVLYTFDF